MSTDRPTPVVVHLSGEQRGTTQRLRGDRSWIGTEDDADVRLSRFEGSPVGSRHAMLVRSEAGYRLEAVAGQPVWVNGERVTSRELRSGDLLEIGTEGPVLRFRLYPAGSPPYKSLAQVFEDCADCARYGARSPLGRAALFVAGAPVELITQTGRVVRSSIVLLLGLLIVGTAALGWRSLRLDRSLEVERLRIEGVARLLEEARARQISPEDLMKWRADLGRSVDEQLESRLESAEARLGVLEQRASAGRRVIAAASPAVVFVQGSYGFLDSRNQRPLRLAVAHDGQPILGPRGSRSSPPRVTGR